MPGSSRIVVICQDKWSANQRVDQFSEKGCSRAEEPGRDAKGIYSVGKEAFIHVYPAVRQQRLPSSNTRSGLAATGLVPFPSQSTLKDSKDTVTALPLAVDRCHDVCCWPLAVCTDCADCLFWMFDFVCLD